MSEWKQIWYWLHISNWRSGLGYLQESPVSHFWSLAIEEQFYLLWPWVVRANREERLLKICVVAAAACLLLRNLPYFLHVQEAHGDFMYLLTPFHMDGLLLGSCIPLLAHMPKIKTWVKKWILPVLAAASAAVIAICFCAGNDFGTLPMARFGYSALALICFGLVFQAVELAGSSSPYAALLRAGWLRRIGEISYGIYIIHYMIAYPLAGLWKRFLPKTGFEFADRLLVIGVSAGIAYILASLSWRLLEQPFLRLKRSFA
jgi:peptidoglycan/LPS O-acetylase OafA/YrhL